jgi:sugar phosphate isomerase/epimerase
LSTSHLTLSVGVKTDPIEYRFSYEWLFRLMAEEDIHHVQLGTFFEFYHLPDQAFIDLRRQAEQYGLAISSIFSAHRELGGFMRPEAGWEDVAHRNYERLIEIGALVGAETVGSSTGSILRDQMEFKTEAMRRYMRHMPALMAYAYRQGVPCLTIEPMSCLAEPPTLPDEIQAMAVELTDYQQRDAGQMAAIGYCVDVAHGYADREGNVVWNNMQLLQAALPYLRTIHLKNTDRLFEATFGFSPAERARGIVQVEAVRDFLLANAAVIPAKELVGYLEISGPKTGRDYSDWQLESMLRESLRYLRQTFQN